MNESTTQQKIRALMVSASNELSATRDTNWDALAKCFEKCADLARAHATPKEYDDADIEPKTKGN